MRSVSRARSVSLSESDKPTDRGLLDKYIAMGIRDIISVPCSITDTWQYLAQLEADQGRLRLIMSNHEGNLPGIAAGIYFGTGRPALVHMQNSGLCNAGDGFISFANKSMFDIPMAVLVTLRGASAKDNSEPHQEIGKRADGLIDLIFDQSVKSFGSDLGENVLNSIENSVAAARAGQIGLLKLSDNAFLKTAVPSLSKSFPIYSEESYQRAVQTKGNHSKPDPLKFQKPISRDDAIRAIFSLHPDAAVLFANGYSARAAQSIEDRDGNFYNIGYMGGTLAIAWGLAKSNKDIEVVVVDGDQNAQMSSMKDHLSIDYPSNLYWYILNNHIGASVGSADSIPLSKIYYDLARVIETSPDEPRSFSHPRVSGKAREIYTLPTITERFRKWIRENSL